MATRRPLVLIGGNTQELPSSDDVANSLPLSGPQGSVLVKSNGTDGTTTWDGLVPTGVSPGNILNIGPDLYGRSGCSHFGVQLARDGDSAAIVKSSMQIARGYQESPYYTPNAGGTAVKMRVSVGAPVIGSSTSARCEHREQDAAGADYTFDALSGTHVFHGRSKIVHAPAVLPNLVMAQLHNGTTDRAAFRIDLISGTYRLRLRVNGSSVTTTLGIDMATGSGTIVGTEYEWKMEIVSNVFKFYLNDMVTPVYTSGASVFTSTGSASWYFKAGCYLQTKNDGSDGDSLSDYGEVELRDLWHTHPSWATPTTYYATAPHKATHATGGRDALAPSDIGALATGATAGGVLTGTYPNPTLALVPFAPYAPSWSASMTIDPTLGNNIDITATGATTLGVSTTGAVNGQTLLAAILASGANRVITLTGITLTSGLASSITVLSGKVGFFGFRYSGLLSAWLFWSYTASL